MPLSISPPRSPPLVQRDTHGGLGDPPDITSVVDFPTPSASRHRASSVDDTPLLGNGKHGGVHVKSGRKKPGRDSSASVRAGQVDCPRGVTSLPSTPTRDIRRGRAEGTQSSLDHWLTRDTCSADTVSQSVEPEEAADTDEEFEDAHTDSSSTEGDADAAPDPAAANGNQGNAWCGRLRRPPSEGAKSAAGCATSSS